MSYDLTFLSKAPDQSWEEALEAAEEADDDSGAPDAAAWARLVPAARELLGEVSVHEADGTFYELDHEPTGIQLSLYAGEAAITVPYWFSGADAARVVDLLYRLALIVELQTGLTGYDPQVESPVAEAAAHPEQAIACFDQISGSIGRLAGR